MPFTGAERRIAFGDWLDRADQSQMRLLEIALSKMVPTFEPCMLCEHDSEGRMVETQSFELLQVLLGKFEILAKIRFPLWLQGHRQPKMVLCHAMQLLGVGSTFRADRSIDSKLSRNARSACSTSPTTRNECPRPT